MKHGELHDFLKHLTAAKLTRCAEQVVFVVEISPKVVVDPTVRCLRDSMETFVFGRGISQVPDLCDAYAGSLAPEMVRHPAEYPKGPTQSHQEAN